jgi:LmbE family N-acetylglucosaminyl deacetylase
MLPRVLRAAPLVALACLLPVPLPAQLTPASMDRGGNGLGLALRRLGVTGRVLYVTAHPDDESNGVLVRLSRGLGLRTALLTLTRGEGGQNAIGPELGEALGVVRTEELLAVHREDGVEQYFARAYEFGFSLSAEETLAKWGHEETLGDVVRVFRTLRPDLVITMPLEGRAHQHHTVSARLARQAFRDAADPQRFPEQFKAGLRPWQAAKLYESGVGGGPATGEGAVRLPTSAHDPLLGSSAHQLGALARALHRSQASRQMAEDPGVGEGTFLLVDREPGRGGTDADFLEGIDVSLRGLARFAKGQEAQAGFLEQDLAQIEDRLREAGAAFDSRAPGKAADPLGQALLAVRKAWDDVAQSRLSEIAREELLGRLDDEERETARALALAQGIAIEARLDAGTVVPGQDVNVAVSVWNQGTSPLTVEDAGVEAPGGWSVTRTEGEPRELEAGQGLRLRYTVSVPASAHASAPYWKRDPKQDRYRVEEAASEGMPWSPPDVTAAFRLRTAGVPLRLDTPAVFRYVGPAGGEKQHVLRVVPALSVRLSPEVLVFPLAGPRAPREVRVVVVNEVRGPSRARLRVVAPDGWRVEPPEAPVRLEREKEEATVRFYVTPPASPGPPTATLRAVAVRDGVEYTETVQEIAYPHIQTRQRLTPAEAVLLAFDVRMAPRVAVGYVMGTGDLVPEAMAQLGLPVTLLTAEDLAFADLRRFSTIAIGVRAYETRADLRSAHARLMKYVEGGGHLLVQYHRAAFNGGGGSGAQPADSPYAPWPASVSSRRLTDETAKLEALVPGSPVFTTPNRIGEADWSGWVQERAIQLLDTRDARYVDLLAGADPFPLNPGTQKGILVETKVGKGTWTYTGLVLFRQLPAGNPGAYRLLANLLSRPRVR